MRTWTEFLETFTRGGFYQSLCTPSFITQDRVAGLWTYLFVLSKVKFTGCPKDLTLKFLECSFWDTQYIFAIFFKSFINDMETIFLMLKYFSECRLHVFQIMELFDTAFIVLRKQKLIFLHWYHHITVMWMSFFSYIDLSSSCRLFMVMNYSVHSIMYTYYALKAMRVKLPKVLSIFITSCQIIQMIFGLFITITVFQYKNNGKSFNI